MFTRTSVVWAESMVATRSSSGLSQISSVSASGYSRIRRGTTSEIGAASDLTASGGACGRYVYFARQPGIIYADRSRTLPRERGELGDGRSHLRLREPRGGGGRPEERRARRGSAPPAGGREHVCGPTPRLHAAAQDQRVRRSFR